MTFKNDPEQMFQIVYLTLKEITDIVEALVAAQNKDITKVRLPILVSKSVSWEEEDEQGDFKDYGTN